MPGAWTDFPAPPIPGIVNLAPNGACDFWQAVEGGTPTVAFNASPPRIYGPDRWYVNNGIGGTGTPGVITISRQTGKANGSKYGFKAVVSTAPVTAPANVMELYYMLLNRDSLALYGAIATAGVYVTAFGNVNQVGVQFFTATGEGKLGTAVGPKTLIPVNTTTATFAQVTAALGTGATTSGIVGVRISVEGVSSGHVYDLNNGLQAEQLIITQGVVNLSQAFGYGLVYPRCGDSFANELIALQYDYQKNFPQGTAPANAVGSATYNLTVFDPTGATGTFGTCVDFPVQMRANPTITTYSPVSANANWRDITNNADRVVTVVGTPNLAGFQVSGAAGVAAATNVINWTADSRPALT